MTDENGKPAEEVIPPTEQVDESYTPPEGSGLASILKDYLPADDEGLDDFTVEGLDEDKALLIKAELDKDEPSIENLEGFSEEELKIVNERELFKASESAKPEDIIEPKLEELDKEALINEIKGKQRLIAERETRIKTLEESAGDGDFSQNDLDDFVKGVRTDLKGSWSKFKEKFDLPDLDLVNRVNSKGTVEERLLQFQGTTLKDKIEKEFKLEKGEFEVVREDLYTPKTPSYRWRKESEKEEHRLEEEIKNISQSQTDTLKASQAQQVKDVEWYAEKYHDGNKEEVFSLVEEINSIPVKINAGELPEDAHPFNVRNLLISANHEKLVKLEVDRAVADLTKQYNDKGFYIQPNELPLDVSKTKGKAPETKEVLDKNALGFSPMMQSINQSIKS